MDLIDLAHVTPETIELVGGKAVGLGALISAGERVPDGFCLTNPKTGLFFLALLPQFTPPGAGALFVVVVMGGTVAATIGVYLLAVALAAHTASTWLNRPTVTRRIELVSGAVFVALGLMTTVPVLASWI